MEKILVVSSNKSASEALVNFLRDSFRCTPKLVESAYQAKTVFDADRGARGDKLAADGRIGL